MSDTKFTPGPWRASCDFDGDHAIYADHHTLIAITDGWERGNSVSRSLDDDAANARLIAAAPELYEALRPFAQFARKWSEHPINSLDDNLYSIHGGDDCEFGASFRLSDCQKALSALAKVEGSAVEKERG